MRLSAVLLYIALSGLVATHSYGQRQRSILVDKKGRLVTSETDRYGTLTYLGSPYLGNVIWHEGTLIYRNQREIKAQIAYNIVFDEVYWRLNDSTEAIQALPDEFTLEGQRFISDQYKVVNLNRVTYFEVLYDGPTKLFRRWTKRIRLFEPKLYTSRVPLEDRFTGEYLATGDLYIQKEGKRAKFIIPTEYSLSALLPNMGSELASFIASHELTDQVLVDALMQYDRRSPSLKQSQ